MTAFADVTVGKEWNDSLTGTSANNRAMPTVTLTGETSYEKLLNLMYPVGSCYFSLDASFDPNSAWGGTWEKLSDGIFLQSTQTEEQVGTSVAAGLPNVTGGCNYLGHTGNVSWGLNTANSGWFGCMYDFNGGGGCYSKAATNYYNADANYHSGIGFDASRSNSIYGRSSTVQPPAIKAFIWKRVA